MDAIKSTILQALQSISFADIGHQWLIVGFVAVAIVLIIFTLEKSKAVLWILVIYAVGFALMQVDQIPTIRYESYIVGALPILGLLVLKFKKKKH